MVLRNFSAFFIAILLLTSCSGADDDQSIVSEKEEVSGKDLVTGEFNIEKGKELFLQHCVACHGSDGKMGIGGSADLSLSKLNTSEVLNVLIEGRKSMPSFRDILENPKNIRSVAHYVLKLRK